MDKVLNQEEIDAMVQAARSGGQTPAKALNRSQSSVGTCVWPARWGASNCRR
jgi:hypothetical protein